MNIEVKTADLIGPALLEPLRTDKDGRRVYRCRCACGGEFEAHKRDFNSGKRSKCAACSPPSRYESPVSRIMKQVEIVTESGCWMWLGKLNDSGYAVGKVDGKEQRIHRYMFSQHVADPGDLMVLHKCDIRCCVNPGHLFLGTAADNLHDCMKKGRFQPGIDRREARKRAANLGDVVSVPAELVQQLVQQLVECDHCPTSGGCVGVCMKARQPIEG